MMSRKGLLLLVIVLVVGLLLFLLLPKDDNDTSSSLVAEDYGSIKLSVGPVIALPAKLINESGRELNTINDQESTVRVPLGKGTYRIVSDGFNDYVFELESYKDVFVVKEINLELKTSNIQEQILNSASAGDAGSISIDNGYWIEDIVYYENNTWATGNLVVNREENDGEKVVVNNKNGKWIIVFAGTGYDEIYLRDSGVPESLISGAIQ